MAETAESCYTQQEGCLCTLVKDLVPAMATRLRIVNYCSTPNCHNSYLVYYSNYSGYILGSTLNYFVDIDLGNCFRRTFVVDSSLGHSFDCSLD